MKQVFLAFVLLTAVLGIPNCAYAQSAEATATDAPATNIALGDTARVKDYLQISPAQENVWNYFVDKVGSYTQQMSVQRTVGATAADSAPRKIGRLVDAMQNRLAALEQLEEASKSLYAVLSEDQKKRADNSLLSAIPVFASNSSLSCPVSDTPKCREERSDTPRKRRGGGPGAMGSANMN
jgi:LTXXQ motif family protein